jgi:hypothetical protein
MTTSTSALRCRSTRPPGAELDQVGVEVVAGGKDQTTPSGPGGVDAGEVGDQGVRPTFGIMGSGQ